MKKEILRNRNSGVTTLEACVIIPIVFMIIMLLIWLGIYQYNRMVFTQVASMAAIKGSQNAEKSNDEIIKIVNSRIEELLDEKLIMMENVSSDIEVNYAQIKVHLQGEFNIPEAIYITDIYEKNMWEIAVDKSAPRIRSSMIIRTAERIRRGLEEEDNIQNIEDDENVMENVTALDN